MNLARFTPDLDDLKPSPEFTRRARQAGKDLERFARSLPDRLPRDLPLQLTRRLPRRSPRLGAASVLVIAAGGVLACVALGAGVRALMRRRAEARAAASPGPALTTPEEIGAMGNAGGPLPDAITTGDDIALAASPAFAGHSDAGLEDVKGDGRRARH